MGNCDVRRVGLTDSHAILRDDFVIVKLAQVVVAINSRVDCTSRAQGRARCDEVGHFEAGSSTVGDGQCHVVVVVPERAKVDDGGKPLNMRGCCTYKSSLLFAAIFRRWWVATAKCGLANLECAAGRVQRKAKLEDGCQFLGSFELCQRVLQYTDENLGGVSLFLLNNPAIGSVWKRSGARGPQWSWRVGNWE